MEIFFIVVISYLLGSIPFGLILTKFFLNKDIREIGSGNIGATNALRTGNKKLGLITLILDILKGMFPVLYTSLYFTDFIFISSICVFLGHVFPVWIKFKGGKGVATYIGILFAINFTYAFVFILIWLFVFLIYNYSSLSSLIGSASIPLYVLIFNNQNLIFFFIMLILIFYTHRDNVKRLKNKAETKTKIY